MTAYDSECQLMTATLAEQLTRTSHCLLILHRHHILYFFQVYLCQIKWIEFPVFRLLEGHHLDEHGPGREVAGGDGVIEVPDNNNINLIISGAL